MARGPVSHRRADTRRNHDRILEVAGESISCGETSFNAIAKKAGVGVGTVYRHFPSHTDLVLAVYRREVSHLVEVVPELLATQTPEQAFRTWATDHLARYMMTKRGLASALQAAGPSGEGVAADAYAAMFQAATTLVEANVAAGTVRSDLDPETVLRGLGGMLYLDPQGGWQRHAGELTDLLWRGMSAG